jgi:hypothetical protein
VPSRRIPDKLQRPKHVLIPSRSVNAHPRERADRAASPKRFTLSSCQYPAPPQSTLSRSFHCRNKFPRPCELFLRIL